MTEIINDVIKYAALGGGQLIDVLYYVVEVHRVPVPHDALIRVLLEESYQPCPDLGALNYLIGNGAGVNALDVQDRGVAKLCGVAVLAGLWHQWM